MARRILLAGLYHETNTFASGKLGLEDFEISRGEELLGKKGDASPLGAFVEEAEHLGWEIVPLIDARAVPGPMPSPEFLGQYFHEFETRAAEAEKIDAIFLVLHGAMVAEGLPDVEGEFLFRIRRLPGLSHLPVFGVLDLHANVTIAMADFSNSLLAYRENPHTDAAESAIRSVHLMKRALDEGLHLKTILVRTGVMWPPTGTGTKDEPMRSLEAIARAEERDGIEAINVFAGFAQADMPETGVSFTIVYDESRVLQEHLHWLSTKLRQAVVSRRDMGFPHEWELGAAIDEALSRKLFPCCLVEPADNIGGGAPGDGTAILRGLLGKQVRGAGVVLNDPEAVNYLQDKTLGEIYEVAVGGKGWALDEGPLTISAKLVRLTDGKFQLEDLQSHAASMGGSTIAMGPSVVLECEGVTILLTSRRTAPFDLGQWRSQGIDPAALTFIGIKAAVAHRQAYDRIAKASYWVRTPGPCTSDLKELPYTQIRRPIYPLDP
ncbi:M81 family metallopeptidase [soil metagenome]